MTNILKLLLTPRVAALAGGKANTVDVLVRVQAPSRPEGVAARPRHDLNIAVVIDRSGSMQGPPLDEACRAAQFVVDQLGATDHCAIVVYDNRADLLVPATRVSDKSRFHAALRGVVPGGNTDLHQGWLLGAEALAPLATGNAVSRVIMLSDGNANAGVTSEAAIVAQVRRLSDAGVTTSTLGLGRDFNEGLMTSIARAGHGRAYYGETAADLMAPFREEFDLLNDLAARKIVCVLKPVPGIGMGVLNSYPLDNQGRIMLPDVTWDSEATIAVRLSVPESMLAGATVGELLSASVGYTDLDGQGQSVASAPLVLSVVDEAAYRAMVADDTVVRRFVEVEASRLQDLARKAAMEGDWPRVDQLLDQIRVIARDNAWVAGVLQEIEMLARRRDRERFAKEARYASESMSFRVNAVAERADLSGDDALRSHLARKLRHGRSDRKD